MTGIVPFWGPRGPPRAYFSSYNSGGARVLCIILGPAVGGPVFRSDGRRVFLCSDNASPCQPIGGCITARAMIIKIGYLDPGMEEQRDKVTIYEVLL